MRAGWDAVAVNKKIEAKAGGCFVLARFRASAFARLGGRPECPGCGKRLPDRTEAAEACRCGLAWMLDARGLLVVAASMTRFPRRRSEGGGGQGYYRGFWSWDDPTTSTPPWRR